MRVERAYPPLRGRERLARRMASARKRLTAAVQVVSTDEYERVTRAPDVRERNEELARLATTTVGPVGTFSLAGVR